MITFSKEDQSIVCYSLNSRVLLSNQLRPSQRDILKLSYLSVRTFLTYKSGPDMKTKFQTMFFINARPSCSYLP